MATIKRFEDLDAWKLSRELCDKIGRLIDSEAFKKNFRIYCISGIFKRIMW
jgi:hypothetical protein